MAAAVVGGSEQGIPHHDNDEPQCPCIGLGVLALATCCAVSTVTVVFGSPRFLNANPHCRHAAPTEGLVTLPSSVQPGQAVVSCIRGAQGHLLQQLPRLLC